MTCNYNVDGICVNADCPYRADYCPCYEEDDICKYKDDSFNQQTAQIEHLSAEVKRLKNFIKDLMKDEEHASTVMRSGGHQPTTTTETKPPNCGSSVQKSK